jgi:DNA-binding GntR family transcriptional regulator
MTHQRKPETNTREIVAAKLRGRVFSGEWGPGAQLPTVRGVAEQYQCSHVTAHEAIKILEAEGLIILRPRQRAVIADTRRSIAGSRERLARSAEGGLFRPTETPEILRAEIATRPHPEALEAFGPDAGDRLGRREYLVRIGGTVVTYGCSYFHLAIWAQVDELRVAEPIVDGAVGAIRRAINRKVAVMPPPIHMAAAATDLESDRLGVPEDSPVLVETTTCIDSAGEVLEWNIQVHPAGYRIGA